MKASKRLPSVARREQLIEAAKRVFARNGFHGTTTRQLAQEAEVTEALLFKHFPSKEAIYKAMLSACHESEQGDAMRRVLELEPSTSTLAILLHYLVNKLTGHDQDMLTMRRMMMRSLSEDGEFARVIYEHVGSTWIAKVDECLQAARKSGDLPAHTSENLCSAWLSHHVIMAVSFIQIPQPPIITYKVSRERLIEEVVLYTMRGIGIKEAAIEEHYNPRALSLLAAV